MCAWRARHWGPASLSNGRLLDPVVSANLTNLTTVSDPETAEKFQALWARADAAREHGAFNATAAWSALVAAMPKQLRLAPVSAGRCGGDPTGSTMGISMSDGSCVRPMHT